MDFVADVRHFERAPNSFRGNNISFITLVPKVVDPINLSDFQPIHVMGYVSKVISKVLVPKLKRGS